VGAHEQSGSGGAQGGAEPSDLGPGHLFGRFDLKIDDVAAGFRGFLEDFELGVNGASEVAAIGFTTAGDEGCDLAMAVEKGVKLRQRGQGLGQVVEA